MSNRLSLRPLSFREACAFIAEEHRHHRPPQGHKFSIGAEVDGRLVGVACVGRPVAKGLQDGFTAEVTRLCTDGTKNVCSLLYSACARASAAMGYRRIITYILASETGVSLKATGWAKESGVKGRSWSCPSRPREDKHPIVDKERWGRALA